MPRHFEFVVPGNRLDSEPIEYSFDLPNSLEQIVFLAVGMPKGTQTGDANRNPKQGLSRNWLDFCSRMDKIRPAGKHYSF